MKLFVTDEELIAALGVPEKDARMALAELDRDPVKSGFPQKQPMWARRRYWPAVQEYFDVVYRRPISAARVSPLSTIRSLEHRRRGLKQFVT